MDIISFLLIVDPLLTVSIKEMINLLPNNLFFQISITLDFVLTNRQVSYQDWIITRSSEHLIDQFFIDFLFSLVCYITHYDDNEVNDINDRLVLVMIIIRIAKYSISEITWLFSIVIFIQLFTLLFYHWAF